MTWMTLRIYSGLLVAVTKTAISGSELVLGELPRSSHYFPALVGSFTLRGTEETGLRHY